MTYENVWSFTVLEYKTSREVNEERSREGKTSRKGEWKQVYVEISLHLNLRKHP